MQSTNLNVALLVIFGLCYPASSILQVSKVGMAPALAGTAAIQGLAAVN